MSLNDTISKALKERIGNLPDGARFATEAELCAEFGVSRMTVNKILTSFFICTATCTHVCLPQM